MNHKNLRWFACAVLVCSVSLTTLAQEATVYATVISTKLFVVGAPNPKTGVFFQHPSEDSVWHHTGAVNIRGNGYAPFPPSKGRIAYIASGNGLHKTTDGGAFWKIVTGWEITEVLGVAADPRNASNVFIASAYGVYKTSDGGSSWRQVYKGFTSGVIVDHANSSILYCAAEAGAFKSTDGGETWKRTGLSVSRIRTIRQNPKDPKTLLVGTEENGIYRTTDAGETWIKMEAGIDHPTFYAIAFDPTDPSIVYAGGYSTGVYKSTDGGTSWSHSCHGFVVDHIHSIAVDPFQHDRVYAATLGDGVYRSDDGGKTWHNTGLPESEVWSISIQPY